jgi:hypothetical protein
VKAERRYIDFMMEIISDARMSKKEILELLEI